MSTTVDVFRAALTELKMRSNAKIPAIAKAAGVSSRHIQGVLSEKEKKGLGAAAQYQVAAFFGMRVAEMMALGERVLAGVNTPTGGAIASGSADIETHHTTTAHQSGPDPPPPPEQEDDDKLPTAPQAIEMTREVLASRTIYRGALLQNIKAFHKAVQGEQEMSSLRDDMQDMKQQMAAMQAMMEREFKNLRQAALPVETPAQKRDVQGG